MNYETFQEYVRVKCLYDAIYQDQEGRDILVIPLLNAYAMVHREPQREWVGLTDEEIWETISRIGTSNSDVNPYAKLSDARAIEAKLKEKNT
jgi:hypothetical protein